MSRATYRARGGESFSVVARRVTGDDLDAAAIQRANPGVSVPLLSGVVLQIPMSLLEPEEQPAAEGVEIYVSGVKLGVWDSLGLSMPIDAIWKGQFMVPNEPITRQLFRPLTSPPVEIRIGSGFRFQGFCDSPDPKNDPNRKELDITFTARPGLLERSPAPFSSFPKEWTDADLSEIAGDVCALYGLSVDARVSVGARFDSVTLEPGENSLQFLSKLATQRGLFLSSDLSGRLVIWSGVPADGSPVARLEKGVHPCENVSPSFRDDVFFSSVTGVVPPKSKKGKNTAEYTVKNPHAGDLIRPHYFEVKDITSGELQPVVEAAAGRMFAGVFSSAVDLSYWGDASGRIYSPGDFIELKSPEDFIEDFYKFSVSQVDLTADSSSRVCILSVVLPGVYSGEIPEVLPWI